MTTGLARNLEVRRLAENLLFDLTKFSGESTDDEKRLGRALVRFLSSSHLSVDALLDPPVHSPQEMELSQ
jgi:hypothetical protein